MFFYFKIFKRIYHDVSEIKVKKKIIFKANKITIDRFFLSIYKPVYKL